MCVRSLLPLRVSYGFSPYSRTILVNQRSVNARDVSVLCLAFFAISYK